MDQTQPSNKIYWCWPRRDKYERKVLEYYIEISTLVSFTDELSESAQQNFSGESQDVPTSLMSGVDGAGPTMEMSGGEGSGEDDEGVDEQENPSEISASEPELEEPQKPGKRKTPAALKEEPCEEENNSCSKTCRLIYVMRFQRGYDTMNQTWKEIETVDETLSQILKMDSKLADLLPKLDAANAKESLFYIKLFSHQ